MNKKYISFLVRFLVVFTLYFISGKYGLDINAKTAYTNLIWVPGGIALAAVWLYGYRMLPAIFLGSVAVSIAREAAFYPSLSIIAASVLEPLLGVYLLRLLKFRDTLEQISDVVKLTIIVAPVISFFSAIPGVLSLILYRPTASLATILTWWSGHLLGIIIVTSLLFLWNNFLRTYKEKNHKYGRELVFLLLTIILYGITLFTNFFGGPNKSLPLIYMAFVPVLWAIFRFDQRITISTISIISFFLFISVILREGPFAFTSMQESAMSLKSFLTFFSITALITGAAVSEKRRYEERKDDFIRIASHELRTPLTSIKMVTQLLQKMHDKKSSTKEKDYLENMNQQINKMTRMINDMLDLSKIQAGKLELRKERFSLIDAVEQSIQSFQDISPNHEFIFEEKKPMTIVGDKDRIGQILLNILSNAVKYSPKGKKIIVSVNSDDEYALVSVKDYGIGIPSDKVTNIFKRFYRAHEDGNATVSGFGLGLYISSEIIKQHGGEIWVESIEGKGSTFYFTLPLS